MRIIYALPKVIGLMLLFGIGILYILYTPNYASRLQYNGQIINITRNYYGIPFISAPSRKAFLYAHGWIVAQDRSFQMSIKRLLTQGRLSQFLGESALLMDKFMREMDLAGWGKRMAQSMKRQNISEYRLLQAMADGINDCMLSNVLPIDFHLAGVPWENWTIANSFQMQKLFEYSQSVGAFDQIYRSSLLVNYTKQQIDQIFPSTKELWAFDSRVVVQDIDIPERLKTPNIKSGQQATVKIKPELIENLKQIESLDLLKSAEGSNVWMVSGNYTQSGKPIFGWDPHLTTSIPSNFYQLQGCYWRDSKQFCFNAFALPGSISLVGKFKYLTAGVTKIFLDNIDFFKEQVEGNKYLVDGEWRELKIRKQLIAVKTDNGTKQIEYIIKETHRGPILNYYIYDSSAFQIPQNISWQWAGANDDYSANLALSYFPQVEDFQYAKQITDGIRGVNVNIGFITADGHIMNKRYGWYPIRKNPEMANYIKDGTSTENDWQGFIPFQDRLTTIDPKSGYIVASNNRGSSDTYYNGLHKYDFYTARADRISQLIEGYIARGVKINAEIAKTIITDTIDSYCQRILPTLLAVLPQSAKLLQNFDCNFTSQSITAPVYELFFSELHNLIKKDNFKKVSLLSIHNNYQYLYNFIKKAQDNHQNKKILQEAWRNLLQNPNLSFDDNGKQTKKWGQIHTDVSSSPFSKNKILSYFYSRSFEGSGNMHTVNIGKMDKASFGNYEVNHRAGLRAVFSYEGPNYWVIDSGESQRFYSKHYDDQWKLFKQNKFIQVREPWASSEDKNQL